MKIRNGFVSNSSSSSFLILGNNIDILDVTSSMIKEKQIYFLGKYLNEGRDIFQIKKIEELAFLKALSKECSDIFFIDAFAIGHSDFEGEINVDKLPKTGKVKYYNTDRDYNSSDSLSDLKERYDNYGKISVAMQVYLRATKIRKIEKSIITNNEKK